MAVAVVVAAVAAPAVVVAWVCEEAPVGRSGPGTAAAVQQTTTSPAAPTRTRCPTLNACTRERKAWRSHNR